MVAIVWVVDVRYLCVGEDVRWDDFVHAKG